MSRRARRRRDQGRAAGPVQAGPPGDQALPQPTHASLRARRFERALAAQGKRPTRRLVSEVLDGTRRDRNAQLLTLSDRAWSSSTTGPVVSALLDTRQPRRARMAAEVFWGTQGQSLTRRQVIALARALLPVLSVWQIHPRTLGRVVEGLQGLFWKLDHRTRTARALRTAVGRLLLEHPSPDVRADAVYALGGCRTREAARLLRRAEPDRAEFWAGCVGAYAKFYGRVCRGDDPQHDFRWVNQSRTWYVARDAFNAALVRAARASRR